MSTSELLYRLLLGASAALGVGGLVAWRFHVARWTRWLWGGGGAVLLALGLVAVGVRWVEAGHLPLFGTFEAALSLAVVVLAASWWWERARRFAAGIAPVGAVVAALSLWHGLRYDATPSALTISERSLVVDVHAVIAWAAFAVLTVNAAFAAATLWRRGAEDSARWLVPTLELGFFLHSAMLASGSLYRFLLFGRAWSFDPIETLGFTAWASYGTLLHMHFFAHWRERRLAAWCLGLFVLLVITYRGIIYFPSWSTYHIFDVALREHLMR